MPRKKKIIENAAEFVPSKYQSAIFDFVQHGQGNAIIEAVAGSGKSTTAIKCLDYINCNEKVLLTAFNNDIVKELKSKVGKRKNIAINTIHSVGYGILLSNYYNVIDKEPQKNKYTKYIRQNIYTLSNDYYDQLDKKNKEKYINNIIKLVDLGRCYMCENIDDMSFVETKYSIPLYYNEKEIALAVMEWGKSNIEYIDYTDMVWLPNVLNCKPNHSIYDWIICDECQDLSVADRMILFRCTKMSTRMLFFGEKYQCIYSFKGGDYRSFDELKKIPNTISLPLSISYRCPQSIVNFVKKFNGNIEARSDAPIGSIKYNISTDEIKDGDMVLCRNNAPLFQLYCDFIKNGKTAYIRGKDIGLSLKEIIQKTKEKKLSTNLTERGVFPSLYDDLISDIDVIMKKNGVTLDMALEYENISNLYDKIIALEEISSGLKTAEELIERLISLFSDEKKNGAQLSTIHKAKGLESNNVFICCPSLLPSKNAKEDWEIEQERNLEYVAYTRAKENLSFLDESNFKKFSMSSNEKADRIEKIKQKIFRLYGGNERCKISGLSVDAAKHILSNIQPIKPIKDNSIDLGNITQKTNNGFLIPKRKTKKKRL